MKGNTGMSVQHLLDRIDALRELSEKWEGYTGRPASEGSINATKTFVEGFAEELLNVEVDSSLTPAGLVTLTIHKTDRTIDLDFNSDGTVEIVYGVDGKTVWTARCGVSEHDSLVMCFE